MVLVGTEGTVASGVRLVAQTIVGPLCDGFLTKEAGTKVPACWAARPLPHRAFVITLGLGGQGCVEQACVVPDCSAGPSAGRAAMSRLFARLGVGRCSSWVGAMAFAA